jgi:hypothetical protein
VVVCCSAFLLSCSSLASGARQDATIEASGEIRFEIYQAATCEGAGPSPVASCSRGHYSGGLEGTGYYAVQSFAPSTPDGMTFITEKEVLRLADGDLYGLVNAVFDSRSADGEVASIHSITGGTGRYAGASGFIRLWRASGERFEYVAVIRLAQEEGAP